MKSLEKRWRIGIDLGGTKIEGAVLDPRGHIVFRTRIPTRQTDGYASIVKRLGRFYAKLIKSTPARNPTLGIGTPGSISRATGLLKNSNTLCLNGKALKQDLTVFLKRSVVFENDANCFALAETHLGVGQGLDMVFGVIMGTGCGGGLVINGKVWTGLQGIGGEWGHMALDPQGSLCYCGSRGCVETLMSGSGLENYYWTRFKKKKSMVDIVKGYRAGGKNESFLMRRLFKYFGRSLANLINILDPSMVILGGGLSNIPELYTEGIAQVKKNIFSTSLETPIVSHSLGDSAGVIGAALVGR